MTILLKNRAGEPIDDWRNWTPPKKSEHWKEGRSAMQLAQSWFVSETPQCPPELQSLFLTNPRTATIRLDEGHPEFVTGLPERGEGRNHDLLLTGHTGSESVVVCVEAKVDEPFGMTIGEYWQEAKARQTPTRAPERIAALLGIVFGVEAQPDQQPWAGLRYQLLTGIAGTLIQAVKEQAPLAVFVVHEFQTAAANPELLRTNARDYARFVEALFSVSPISDGQMYGPLPFAPSSRLLHAVELFAGKAVGK